MPGGWGMNCWVQKTPQGGEAPWESLHWVLGWTGFCAVPFVALSLVLTPLPDTRDLSLRFGPNLCFELLGERHPKFSLLVATCRTSCLVAVTLFVL